MLFGAHVSIAKSLALAPERSSSLGGEIFQIFSRSPRGGNPPAITNKIAQQYKDACKKYRQKSSYIHTPYYINFASNKPRIRHGSISVVRQELERASQLGVEAVMTHLGSGKDYGREKSLGKVIDATCKVFEGYSGSALFLLEQSAGAGGENGIIGGTLEELATILEGAQKIDRKYKNKLGICLDTCHAWAMGYDLSDKKEVNSFLKNFDKIIGLERLKLIHINDSKCGLGEHKDRHEHIGKGKIGKSGFEAIINHPKLKNINMILETPTPDGVKKDIKVLKKFRNS